MYLKTHFKFLFNSSKNYTISADVIFFLDTRLHSDPNKIGLTQIGSTKLEIQILQNAFKNWTNELSYWIWVTDGRDPHVSRVHASATRKTGDGGLSGETKGTSMHYVMRRLDWSYRQGLRSSGGGSSPVMASRQRSGARRRRRWAPNVPSEPGTSYTGSPRS